MSSSDHDNSTEHEVEERIFTTYSIKKVYIVGLVIIGVLVGWAIFYTGILSLFWSAHIGGFPILLFSAFFLFTVKSVTLSGRGIKISKRWKTLTYTWDQIKQTAYTGQSITLILTEDGGYWTSDVRDHVDINDFGFSKDDWKELVESIRNIEMLHRDVNIPSRPFVGP